MDTHYQQKEGRVDMNSGYVILRDTPHTPAECLCQIKKHPSKEDMFQEVLEFSNAEKRERREWRDAERQDRKENQEFIEDATFRIIKVMEEQIQMLKSLIMLQTERIGARPPLKPIQNSFPCPHNSKYTVLFAFQKFSVSRSLQPPHTMFKRIAGPTHS
ncbi:hypothetical protein UY3_06069 [Chelonia mydas]|uniref:Uncharacterized protein n=1 Tax=Chelonia mydas TaxID=8469 RepID=M7BXF2_CHEMY|nr:hypothetical protein UY3_06069 [Chelonia mydas]